MQIDKEKYDTEKIPSGIIEEYISVFKNLKNKKINILEIGILKGGSLKFWADYFTHPETKIIGIDINIPRIVFPKNVITYKCNQNDSILLKKIGEKHGPFNIIIDDGSHRKKETENSLKILINYVIDEGYYVIEDWGAGYMNIERYKGMVDLITEIMKKKFMFGIGRMNIIFDPPKTLAFFRKENLRTKLRTKLIKTKLIKTKLIKTKHNNISYIIDCLKSLTKQKENIFVYLRMILFCFLISLKKWLNF